MAFKRNMRNALSEMARRDPDRLWEMLEDSQIEELWITALKNLILKQSESAVKLYAEIRNIVRRGGGDLNLNVNMDGAQFKELVGVAQDAMDMGPEERFVACLEEVEHHLKENPRRRREVLERLGGRFVETSESLPELVRANGMGG